MLCEHGASVGVLSGTTEAATLLGGVNAQIVKLPSVYIGRKGRLEAVGGKLKEVLVQRERRALESFLKYRPRVLIIELFPFGRHALQGELLILMEAASAIGVPIVISMRDIYVYPAERSRRDAYVQFCKEILERYEPTVMIHSDSNWVPSAEALGECDGWNGCKGRVVHTGFVGRPTRRGKPGEFILASVAGGRSAERLSSAYSALCESVDIPVEVVGRANGGEAVFRPDMEGIALPPRGYIAPAGYNSWMDAIEWQVPTVLVALDEEQQRRSDYLLGLAPQIEVFSIGELCSAGLVRSWKNVSMRVPRPTGPKVNMSGANNSAMLIMELIMGSK